MMSSGDIEALFCVQAPDGWQASTVASGLVEIIDYRGKTPPKSASGIPLISAANVKSGRIDLQKASFISELDYQRWTVRGFTQPGDVLITTEAPVGEVAAYPKSGTYQISRRVMALRADEETLHSGFLLFALQSPAVQATLLARNRGTTVPRVLKPDITELELLLPPLAEQRRIAAVLGALDDKIELNRKMNQTLESMAQALFKSWFVDYDPAIDNALRAGNPIPDDLQAKATRRSIVMARDSYEIPPYAKLFPDSFEDSELGSIPAGWGAGHVDDLMELKRGYDLPKRLRQDGPVPIISSSGRSGWHNESKVQAPGVVTGRYGTIGRVFFVESAFWPLNTALYVRDFKGNSERFIYHFLSLVNFEAHTGKSAVPGVNRNHLHQDRAVLPPRSIQKVFDDTVSPLWTKNTACSRESTTLAALRDTLLPKLISGEVRVPASAVPGVTE